MSIRKLNHIIGRVIIFDKLLLIYDIPTSDVLSFVSDTLRNIGNTFSSIVVSHVIYFKSQLQISGKNKTQLLNILNFLMM